MANIVYMKVFYQICLISTFFIPGLVMAQGTPSNLSYFDAKIDESQQKILTLDVITGTLKYAATTKADSLQAAIEKDASIDNNNKIKFLRGFNEVLEAYYTGVKDNALEEGPGILPALIDVFANCMHAEMRNLPIDAILEPRPYDIGHIITDNYSFASNSGVQAAKDALVVKYCLLHPNRILETLTRRPDLIGGEVLIVRLAHLSPEAIYDYAAANDALANRIRTTNDPLVKIISQMARLETGRQFFPFLDDIYHGKLTFFQIDSALNDSTKYYKLMVQTAINYADRIRLKDTPMAMQALASRMFFKAREIYVSVINDLHEAPDETRFKIIDKLSPEELYYLPILTEEEIYTSSYVKGVYPRIFKKLSRSDSLLMRVRFDRFRKWIKIAANFNTLDDFLGRMDKDNAELMMKAFVNGLDKTGSLEDAVDVANSFGSINNPNVRKLILNQVQFNLQKAKAANNKKGRDIYSTLNTLFLSMDTANHVDVSRLLGIPPVYYMPAPGLKDADGKIVVEQFFYGDKDGNEGYSQFRSDFSNENWKITDSAKWITVTSTRGTKVVIYANKPLDEKKDLDRIARQSMIEYLDAHEIEPSILIHRGHSYYLNETLEKLQQSEKIVLLGSCGGYQSLKKVLGTCPTAHIVASKQTGSKTVNGPLIVAAMEMLRQGKDLNWLILWSNLGKQKLNKELFEDYIPPYKNLGALFIMAYNKKQSMQEQ